MYNHRRTGRGGGRFDMNSGRESTLFGQHNTCLNKPNLKSVTAVNGNILALPPPPSIRARSGRRNISATTPPHRRWIQEMFCYYPPPHRIHSGKTRFAPPPQMLARTPMSTINFDSLVTYLRWLISLQTQPCL